MFAFKEDIKQLRKCGKSFHEIFDGNRYKQGKVEKTVFPLNKKAVIFGKWYIYCTW